MSVLASLNFDSDTTGIPPTGFNALLLNVSTTQSDSSPKSVVTTTSSTQSGGFISSGGSDTADSRVRCAFYVTAAASRTGTLLRYTGSLVGNTYSGYYPTLAIGGGAGNNGLAIYKVNGGALTLLGADDQYSASFSLNAWYAIDTEVSGTTINVRVQRKTDALWLQTDGTWNTTATICLTRTDSSITGAATGGIRVFGGAGNIFADTFYWTTVGDTTGYYVASDPGIDVAANVSGTFWSTGNVVFTSGACNVIENGTYTKFNFSGTALGINLNVAALKTASIAVGNWGSFICVIDGLIATKAVLSDPGTGINAYTMPLVSGLANISHTVEIWRDIVDETNKWTATPPASSVQVTGWHLDTGASISAPSGIIALRPDRWIIFGDSIVMGYNTTPNSYGTNYPPMTLAQLFLRGMNAEGGTVGNSGQGYLVAGTGSETGGNAFRATYASISNGVARTLTGLTGVVIAMGTNDSSDVTTEVGLVITAMRASVGSSCWIVLATPFTANARTPEIKAAVATYQAANPSDTKVRVVDTSTILPLATGFNRFDSVHPNEQGFAMLGSVFTGAVQRATATATGAFVAKRRPL